MNVAQKLFADAMNETAAQSARGSLSYAVMICQAMTDNQKHDLAHFVSEGRMEEALTARAAVKRMERMLETVIAAQEAAR